MSAPAGWQKGSFRGVPFVTIEHDAAGGRRLQVHEFPQGEKPVPEDLGKRAATFTLECYVRGADHIAQANTLAAALNEAGAGTLIHPWLGSMQVHADSFSRRDSVNEGLITSFSIDFVEAGLPAMPPPATDTAAIAGSTADAEAVAAQEGFASGFSLESATAFVEQAAEKLAKGMAIAVQVKGALSGGPGGVLGAIDAIGGIISLPGALRDIAGFAKSVTGMVTLLGAAGASIDSLLDLFDWGEGLDPVIGTTPAREQERTNQDVLVQLFDAAIACQIVRTTAATGFASYDEAVSTREAVADRLDRLAIRQADAGDDVGADAYDALRRAMVRDVTARGGSLARLQSYTPVATEPALVIANRLYGPVSIEARASEIVARNRIAHPGFVPAGVAIQVLTPSGLEAAYG